MSMMCYSQQFYLKKHLSCLTSKTIKRKEKHIIRSKKGGIEAIWKGKYLYLERECLYIFLYIFIAPITTDQTFSIKNGILRIGCQLILSSITNQSFTFTGESNIGWCDTITLVIWDNFNTSIFENTDTVKIKPENSINKSF